MSQLATEVTAITTQPLLSSTNVGQVLGEATNTNESLENADVITTQPLTNDPSAEEQKQEKKFSQFNPTMNKPPERKTYVQSNGEVEECSWCCITCTDLAYDCNCDCGDCVDCCADCDCCTGCCDNGHSADNIDGDCCAGCCDSGPSADNIDGADVGDCLDCCIACFECCKDD